MRTLIHVLLPLVAVCTTASLVVAQPAESTRPPSMIPGFITKFPSSPPTVDDSIMSQVGSNTINVNGNINLVSASSAYRIGGGNVLAVPGTDNLFLGLGAGAHNTSGSGNTFSGEGAGAANTYRVEQQLLWRFLRTVEYRRRKQYLRWLLGWRSQYPGQPKCVQG